MKLFVGWAVPTLLVAHAFAADDLELGKSAPAIVSKIDDPIVAAAGAKLEEYLRAIGAGTSDPTSEITLSQSPDGTNDESFSVAHVSKDAKSQLIVTGKSAKGIKQGAYYVLKNLAVDHGKIVLHNATHQSSPVLKLRVSHIGGAMGPHATVEQLDWNMIAHWEPQRIGDYIDMLDLFGYNGIEEPPTFYRPEDQTDQMIARRKALREHRVRNGQLGIAKIDGTLLGAGTYTTNTPYGADAKDKYDAYYRGMAETAAPYNDIVLTHWVDPGGWPSTADHPCTIEVLQDLHNQITVEFRRVNPQIKSILSLWNMQNKDYDRWKGYQPRGVETILSSSKIPKEVGFTQSRIYRAEEADKILAAGHPLGIWGWYTADNELTYTMHIHTHQLKAAMNALPADAGDRVSFYSIDNCQREFNIYSTYVAGQMLWDSKSDPEAHLREIARLIYGPKLEEPIFRALKAIADIRCGTNCRAYFFAGKDGTNGVVDLDDGLRQASDAWNGIKDLQIDKSYIPPIKFHRAPDVLLDELKEQVHAVATYMQFLKDKRDGKTELTEVPSVSGPFETYERMQYLKQR